MPLHSTHTCPRVHQSISVPVHKQGPSISGGPVDLGFRIDRLGGLSPVVLWPHDERRIRERGGMLGEEAGDYSTKWIARMLR